MFRRSLPLSPFQGVAASDLSRTCPPFGETRESEREAEFVIDYLLQVEESDDDKTDAYVGDGRHKSTCRPELNMMFAPKINGVIKMMMILLFCFVFLFLFLFCPPCEIKTSRSIGAETSRRQEIRIALVVKFE